MWIKEELIKSQVDKATEDERFFFQEMERYCRQLISSLMSPSIQDFCVFPLYCLILIH